MRVITAMGAKTMGGGPRSAFQHGAGKLREAIGAMPPGAHLREVVFGTGTIHWDPGPLGTS